MGQDTMMEYRRTQVEAMTGPELVVLLYSGAIRFLHEARTDIERERFDQSWQKFDKARKIVVHLCGTLNQDAGPIAGKLNALYAFVVEQITVANASRDLQFALIQ